jgi:branched-chain amino acid transport system substrate-binding protein
MDKRPLVLLLTTVFLSSILVGIPVGGLGAESKVLRIGGLQNYSLPIGIQTKKTLELLAEQLNKAGGLNVGGETYKLEVIVEDFKMSTELARAAAEKLVHQDKVIAIISVMDSGANFAAMELTEPKKIITMGAASAPPLVSSNYKYHFCTGGIFFEGIGFNGYIGTHGSPCKSGVIIEPDDESGRAVGEREKGACQRLFGQDVEIIYTKRGVKDYSPLALKIKSRDPDFVNFSAMGQGPGAVLIAKALHEAGYRGQIRASLGASAAKQAIDTGRPELFAGAYVGYGDVSAVPNPSPQILAFRKAYEAKYGVWEYDYVPWVDWQLMIEGLKKAGSLDPDKVVAAIEGMELQTLSGYLKMVPRPDLKQTRAVDCVRSRQIGQVRGKEIIHLGEMRVEDQLKWAEKVCGASFTK